MRPYGIPRVKDLEFPDLADIQRFGLASHLGRLREKSGVFKSYSRTKNRNSVRRYWKKKVRNRVRNSIRFELQINKE